MDGHDDRFRRFLDRSTPPPLLYGVLALAALLLLADGYDTQVIGYVAPALIKTWGLKKAAMGPVFSIGLLGIMFGAMALTMVADRFGGRRVLIASTAAFGVLSLATAFARNIDQLLILRLLSGAALGSVMPNAVALVWDYAPTRLRNTFATVVMCGFTLGGSLGGVVGALAIQRFGWSSAFLVGGAAPLLLLAPMVVLLPESPGRALRGQGGARANRLLQRLAPSYTASPEALAARPHVSPARRTWPVAGLFTGGIWPATGLIWLIFFLNLLIMYTMTSWLPTIMTSAGLSMTIAGLATSGYQLGGCFGSIGIGILCDRFGSGRVLPLVFLGAGVVLFLIGASGTHIGILACTIGAAGFCLVGGQTASNAFAGGYYPAAMRATGMGWALGVGRLGSIIGPLAAGWLIGGGAQPQTLFQLCAVAALIAATAMVLVARRPRPSGIIADVQAIEVQA